MWVELTTMRAPDYFGEAAMLGRGIRHAAAIADSTVEVLVLLKVDFDLKIDTETRDVLNVLVSQYPNDANFVKRAATPPKRSMAHD
jgi:CRP-like cAMP-binding protein